MSRPDEGLIHTWLDGECSAEEAAHVERMVAADPAWAAAVAEARGLIAASSRIVSALDAVPSGVMPAGSKAAPGAEKIAPASPELRVNEGFRVQPWMKMAAGLVLVAGTAFAIRGTTREVFAPPTIDAVTEKVVGPETAAAVPLSEPAAAADAAPAAPRAAIAVTPSATVPASSPAPSPATTSAAAPEAARERSVAKAAPVAASAPTLAPALAPPTVGASGAGISAQTANDAERAERFAAAQRRLQNSPLRGVVTTGTRGAEPERILDSPNSIAAMLRLEGCWSVTAPDSLRMLLRNPVYTRGNADSIIVEFVLGSTRRVTVLQNGDALRGEITAERVECTKP